MIPKTKTLQRNNRREIRALDERGLVSHGIQETAVLLLFDCNGPMADARALINLIEEEVYLKVMAQMPPLKNEREIFEQGLHRLRDLCASRLSVSSSTSAPNKYGDEKAVGQRSPEEIRTGTSPIWLFHDLDRESLSKR